MAYETYTPMFSEIAKRVHNAKDKPTKIKVLNKYRSPAWEMFLKSALDPRIEWMLPEGRSRRHPPGLVAATRVLLRGPR